MSLLKRQKRSRGASMRRTRSDAGVNSVMPVLKKTVLSGLLLVLLVLLGLNSRTVINDVASQRIEYVVIEGELQRVTESDIQAAVFNFISRSMVAVDLDQIKLALESNAWIKSASLQRKWPNTLIVNVTEELPIARWGANQLLNQDGNVFSPTVLDSQFNLARLSGPAGSEKQVMEQYQVFNQLLYPQNIRIASLSLNSRGAWSMTLTNNISLSVGSISPVQRVRRFARVYDSVFAERINEIERFDLRYEDGIAVAYKAPGSETLISMQ
jgi:cell division protein FtsQ